MEISIWKKNVFPTIKYSQNIKDLNFKTPIGTLQKMTLEIRVNRSKSELCLFWLHSKVLCLFLFGKTQPR